MDIGKSFGYIFEDKNWLSKVLIGALIILVSVPFTPILIGFLGLAIVTGYTLEVLRNVRHGAAQPLPEWRDRWSEWLVAGIKLGIAIFVWSLPALLLSGFNRIGMAMAMSNSDLLSLFGGLTSFGIACLSFLWWIVVALATPAITIRMAETGDITDAFRFNDIYVWTRNNIGDVVVAVLVSLAAMIIAAIVGSVAGVVLCIIGLAITLPAAFFLADLVTVHLYAQIGQAGQRKTRSSASLAAVCGGRDAR